MIEDDHDLSERPPGTERNDDGLRTGYDSDPMFKKILSDLAAHEKFSI